MPEGDTIHQTASRLRDALATGPLVRFEAPSLRPPHPEPGEPIEEITARGKHLLIRFAGGLILHTHLGMDGSWRLEHGLDRPAISTRGRPPGVGPQVRVGTARASAVCAGTRTVALLREDQLGRHPILASLGPDLCDPAPDLDETLRRLAALHPATPVGVVLLDQRPACGIGNVYRSEVLWACERSPLIAIGAVGDEDRRRLYATAHRLLRANLDRRPRRTVPEGLAVYERAGRRCRRCGHTIVVRRIGEQARSVWWCPGCQTDG